MISVVIPALDEEKLVTASVESALRGWGAQVILADGGSADRTVAMACAAGAIVVTSPPGRARQMNAGAAAATGEILLFLHADTRLPEGYQESVREILARPGVSAGAFSLRIDGPGAGLRMIEAAANWRSRHLRLPYGDQAIFLTMELFRSLGGFPEIPILEDFALVRKLRNLGGIAVAPAPVATSARRWLQSGCWRTTMIHQAVVVGYLLGISPERLTRGYGRFFRRVFPGRECSGHPVGGD